eukprot:TRINITY_DN6577_c0_g1_i1.p1 TRINITY_DN6577_c0_g1~~TRINITY_DN6577_c0_g1_i1.p1  ORF type:complete len:259 (+),score=33.70 TRINITY_DN6577_c0_g1_i1:137-913(+)
MSNASRICSLGHKLCRNNVRLQIRNRRVSARCGSSLGEENLPWQIGTYYSKKKDRKLDEMGRFCEESLESLKEPVQWNAQGQFKVALLSIANDENIDVQFLNQQVDKLFHLLPDLQLKMPAMKAAKLVKQLAMNVDEVGQQIITWRLNLPSVDLMQIIMKWPQILFIPYQQIPNQIYKARELLQNPEDFEGLAEKNPQIFDIQLLQLAIEQFERLYQNQEGIVPMLRVDENVLDSLVPLDNQSRGDRDDEYLSSTLQA